ncbi:MAG: hypothetical protein RR928_10130 [Comamonas sp.]|uniref:hypothetical protein n=1 Tax=Comamonas sp. TaxID=34028 RepID=UPI002FCA586A
MIQHYDTFLQSTAACSTGSSRTGNAGFIGRKKATEAARHTPASVSTFCSISMSFLYNSLNTIWNQATSYFPATAKYCETNNISWTTTGNLASEIGFIATKAPLAAAEAVGNAAMNAATEVAATTHALAYGAKDRLAKSVYSALEQTHATHCDTTAGKSDGDAKSSATMVAKLAEVAGSKLLDFGYAALKIGYAALADKTTQMGSAAWSEVKAQAPVLGAALLGGVEYVAGKVGAAAHEGQDTLSTKPLDLGPMAISFPEDDLLQFSDMVFVTVSDVLPGGAAPASVTLSTESRYSDEEHAIALQARANDDFDDFDDLSDFGDFSDFGDQCVALTGHEGGWMPNVFASSIAMTVY